MNLIRLKDYIILLVFCLYFYIARTEVSDSEVRFFLFMIVFNFLRIFFSIYRKNGLSDVYVFFVINFGIFLYSRVFLDFLGFIDFGWANKFNYFEFSNLVRFELLFLLGISFQLIFIGYNLPNSSSIKSGLINLPNLESYAKKIFIISSPGLVYKYFLQFKYVITNGYLSLYNGSINSLKYPFWTFGSGFLVELSYAMFLASMPKKKTFVLFSTIFMLLQILDVLKGGRSKLFLPLMFVIWFYNKFYKNSIRINLFKLFSFGVVLIVVSQSLLIFRDSNNVVLDLESYSSLFVIFFQQQGVSILVPAYLIHYKGVFINESLPYILYPLDLFDNFSVQSTEYVKNTLSLGSKLTYFLSPKSYLDGQGIGSSYVAELYDLGYLGVMTGSLVLGFLIKKFSDSIIYSRYLIFISYILFESIVYMPRASYFPPIKLILGLSCFYVLYKLFNTKSFGSN